jgi:hypothetical protein
MGAEDGSGWSDYEEDESDANYSHESGDSEHVSAADPFAGKKSRPVSPFHPTPAYIPQQQQQQQREGYHSSTGHESPRSRGQQQNSLQAGAFLAQVAAGLPQTTPDGPRAGDGDEISSPLAVDTGEVKIGTTRQIEDNLLLFV